MATRNARSGFTLIELLVSMGLSTIIMMGAFAVFKEGMDLYRANQMAANAQTNVARVLGLLSIDLANAAGGVTVSHTATGGRLSGITFATPLGEGGQTRYDPDNGDLYWQRYMAFYFEPDPDAANGGFNGKIWRAWEEVEPVSPDPGPGDRNTAEIMRFLANNPTNYFAASPKCDRKMLSDGISGFTIEPYKANENFAGITSDDKIRLAYDITVAAGSLPTSSIKRSDSYYIKVTSRVVPRGGGG